LGGWPILAAVSNDLFNFVCDPATLLAAFGRVAGNRCARTPGIDGLTVADVEEIVGVQSFLDNLRADLKTGLIRPLPVRERLIPSRAGREGFGDSEFR
jgi:RNA-directed DNA polymerase